MGSKIKSLMICLIMLVILMNSCSSIKSNTSKKDTIKTTVVGEDIELRNELRHQERKRDRNNRHRHRSLSVSFL